jgi:hypothetical protein
MKMQKCTGKAAKVQGLPGLESTFVYFTIGQHLEVCREHERCSDLWLSLLKIL